MGKSKENTWIYGRDGTVPNSNDDYSHSGTATLEKPSVLHPYEPHLASARPKYPLPSQDSSKVNVTAGDLADVNDRVERTVTCLQRAKEYLAKDDPMQASEKLYKAMEESIKFLAEVHTLSEVSTADEKGKWSSALLATSSKKLSEQLSMSEIDEARAQAWDAHVFGFHENKFNTKQVTTVVPYVEKLINYVVEVDNARRESNP